MQPTDTIYRSALTEHASLAQALVERLSDLQREFASLYRDETEKEDPDHETCHRSLPSTVQ